MALEVAGYSGREQAAMTGQSYQTARKRWERLRLKCRAMPRGRVLDLVEWLCQEMYMA